MITDEQVYAQLPLATRIAGAYRITGYDTHDLAMDAILHLHRRCREANEADEDIIDYKNWSARVIKRRILDIRRSTLLTKNMASPGTLREVSYHSQDWLLNNDGEEAFASGRYNPLRELVLNEQRAELDAAVKQLSPAEQQVFHDLASVYENSHPNTTDRRRVNREAADKLGMTTKEHQRLRANVIRKVRSLVAAKA